jgi:putative ABC transport system substrate-binding protein
MRFVALKRREFIKLFGSMAVVSAVALPCAAGAPERAPMRRIGVLMHLADGDEEGKVRLAAFLQALDQLGWNVGRNVQIETRWGGSEAERHKYAADLVALKPDVILASTTLATVALQQATRSVPVVFANVADAVGAGFVENLAHPGGNVTGFTHFEYTISSKWLELLKEVAPKVKRVGVIRDPANPAGIGQFAVVQSAAATMRVEVTPIVASDAGELEHGITAFARSENDGLIVLASALGARHSKLIVALAAQHKLPAIYPFRFFAVDGGLVSYGPDTIEHYRLAAGYVDRVLRGQKPGDLPVQASTKYELVVNLKTARALGAELPPKLLGRAAEVIE